MEVLAQAQTLVVEHAFTIGICLLIATLLAGLVWFSMSGSRTKSSVLENKARVNEATMESVNEPEVPPQEYLEEMARRAASQEQPEQPVEDTAN